MQCGTARLVKHLQMLADAVNLSMREHLVLQGARGASLATMPKPAAMVAGDSSARLGCEIHSLLQCKRRLSPPASQLLHALQGCSFDMH